MIRLTRIILGLHLDDLAASTGLSKSYLSLLERGLRPLTPAAAEKIAAAFGVSPEARR